MIRCISIISLISLLFLNACSVEKKADKGDIDACYAVVEKNTNYGHFEEELTEKQKQKIIKYSLKAIEIDTNEYDLSYFYYKLASVTQDNKLKYHYYQKAAKYDDNAAQWITGLNYFYGRTISINNDSALYWFQKASNGNSKHYSAIATTFLGSLYMEGKTVKKDSLLALYYFKKACTCFENYSTLEACDSVVANYSRNKNIIDTSDIAVYKELVRIKKSKMSWK